MQRQIERSAGILWGIALTGIIFGAYHLQLTKIIPLSVLGIYLGFITWRTGSILPAVVVHFANNAVAVVIGTYAARRSDMDLADLASVHIPWYFIAAGFLFLAAAVRAMNLVARDCLTAKEAVQTFQVATGGANDDEEES